MGQAGQVPVPGRQVGERQHTMGTQTSDRRARILAATLRVVGHDGVASITTRKIAQEAGVNLSALHRHFSSKDALLLAALDEATTLMIAALPAPPAAGW